MAIVKSLVRGPVLLAVALALQKGSTITNIEFATWLIIVAMSVAGFGGVLFLLEGIKKIGTSRTMVILLLTSVFGRVILLDWPINN
jgi:drug/metabolite transporter (DMT)-like permease